MALPRLPDNPRRSAVQIHVLLRQEDQPGSESRRRQQARSSAPTGAQLWRRVRQAARAVGQLLARPAAAAERDRRSRVQAQVRSNVPSGTVCAVRDACAAQLQLRKGQVSGQVQFIEGATVRRQMRPHAQLQTARL